MQAFLALFNIDKTNKTPVFLQISGTFIENIRRGVLSPGMRLPGTRSLAEGLGLHRKTVIAAYEELSAQGWIETIASSGAFVSRKIPEIKPTPLPTTPTKPGREVGFSYEDDPLLHRPVIIGVNQLTFNDGFPDLRLAPMNALSRAFRTAAQQGYRKNLLSYGDTCGESSLRAAMAAYLRETRGLPIREENVLITRGSTMALYLAANIVLRPGDTAIVGKISYGSANLIFQKTGAELLTVPVDAHGLDVDSIEEICRSRRVRMVYVTPHHHYPTTVTMPAERRLRLLQLAQSYGFCILEDDYDYDFHYDSNPVLPLAGVDTGGHVIYVGSLCKSISPALRIGYAVAPPAALQAMGRFRRIIDRQGDSLLEAAVALMFREGDIRRHLKKAQKTYHRRRDVFCALLKDQMGSAVSFARPTGGMAVWATFDPAAYLPNLAQKARAKGLIIPDGSGYAPGMNATRLGFASLNEAEIEQGIAILKTCL